VYLAWERGPSWTRVAGILDKEVLTHCGLRITADDRLDNVAQLENQCEETCVPHKLSLTLFISGCN
jgi:hypothetical protein